MSNRLESSEAFRRIADDYCSTSIHNDAVWDLFSERTDHIPLLRDHRDWIEANRWGFGDRAFHYMWLLLLQDVAATVAHRPELLEIGVFKGQILSLWALIARELGADIHLTGISPLSGKPPLPRVLHRARMIVDRGYRQDAHVGNLHVESDFARDVETVFARFGLDMGCVNLIRGISQDEPVWRQVSGQKFDIVYVDGGHRYEEVSADLRLYGPLVRAGGYLVIDDAAFFEPGTRFFKGFESVSKAANELDPAEYANVLNVGHNRIYRRRSAAR